MKNMRKGGEPTKERKRERERERAEMRRGEGVGEC